MVSGNTESLNYAGNDGTCDHSWLTILLGNAPQIVLPAFYSCGLRLFYAHTYPYPSTPTLRCTTGEPDYATLHREIKCLYCSQLLALNYSPSGKDPLRSHGEWEIAIMRSFERTGAGHFKLFGFGFALILKSHKEFQFVHTNTICKKSGCTSGQFCVFLLNATEWKH